jgi:OOP family OmpA-OmpF porin
MQKGLLGCGILALTLAASATRADDAEGIYLGASVGEASQSQEGFNGSDTSFKVFGGWSFNKYFAAEGGYINGGTQKDRIDGLDVAISSEGAYVALLGKLPVGDVFSPYLKLGYAFYDAKTVVSADANSLTQSQNNNDLLYGIGGEFHLGEHFNLRAEFEKVDVKDVDFQIYSLGATWRF